MKDIKSKIDDKIKIYLKTLESGNEEKGQLTMKPISLFESKYCKTNVSLSKLFNKEKIIPTKCNLKFEDYMLCVCRGGWLSATNYGIEESIINTLDIANKIYSIPLSSKKRISFQICSNLIRSISRNIMTSASFKKIHQEVVDKKVKLSEKSTINYYKKLVNNFIIEELEAWDPYIRSRTKAKQDQREILLIHL